MKTSGNRQISKPLHSEEYKLMVSFIRDICNIVKFDGGQTRTNI